MSNMALFGRTKTKLTPRQRAQRKYASAMRTVRKRAKTARGGRGQIGTRSAATKLRRKLRINAAKRKGRKVGRKTVRSGRRATNKVRRSVTRRF